MSDRICSVEGCSKPENARGWCKGHYYRWTRYADPLGAAPPRTPRPPTVRKACSVADCDEPRYGRGWCANHYARWRRHGGLHDKRAERTDPMERFTARLDPNGPTPAHRPDLGPCTLWIGPPNSAGYGSFGIGTSSPVGAHVAAVILDGRQVPTGMEVDHLCRTRMCVRADHLEVVTHEENVRRALAFRETPEACPNGHLLTQDNLMPSQGARACRTCFKDSQRRYRQKRKTSPV